MPTTAMIRRLDGEAHPGQIQLQGLGWVPAIPAGDLEIGDILSWNNAPDSMEVTGIKEASEHYVVINMVYRDDPTGKVWSRRLKKDRLVGARRPDEGFS